MVPANRRQAEVIARQVVESRLCQEVARTGFKAVFDPKDSDKRWQDFIAGLEQIARTDLRMEIEYRLNVVPRGSHYPGLWELDDLKRHYLVVFFVYCRAFKQGLRREK